MKTLLTSILLAAGLGAAVFASSSGAATAAPAAPAQGRPAFQRARMAIVAQRLGLSDAQKAQAKAIREQANAATRAIRENSALTPDQKHEQVVAAGRAARDQWRALLTPDQQAQLTQIRSHPRLLNALAVRRVRVAALTRQLGVTPEQRTSLQAVQGRTAAAVKAVRHDPSLDLAQRQAKVRELMQSARTEMRATLTPEQLAKLQQVRRRMLAPLGPFSGL